MLSGGRNRGGRVPARRPSAPVDIRAAVLQELERRGVSRGWLARQPGVTCGRDAVLRWLAGRGELAARSVGECMAALGLTVRRARG